MYTIYTIIVYRSIFKILNFFFFQYAMFLLAIFLLEVAVGVFLYYNRDQAEEITRKSMTIVLNDYSNKTESRAFFDEIQNDVSDNAILQQHNI